MRTALCTLYTLVVAALLASCRGGGAEPPTARAPRVIRLEHQYVNVYLVVGDKVIIVDAGYAGDENRILRGLRRAGYDEADVSLIVITHAHADHAGATVALRERLGVPVMMGATDRLLSRRGHRGKLVPTGGPGRRIKPLLRRKTYPAFDPEIAVEAPLDLRPFGIEGRVIPVGGHTPGSVAVVLDSGDAVTGDLVRGHFLARRRPTLHYFHADQNTAHESLREILDSGTQQVHPGHGHTLAAEDVMRWLDR